MLLRLINFVFRTPPPPPPPAAAGKKKKKKIGFRKQSPEWAFLKTLAYRFPIRCHTSYSACRVRDAIVFPSFQRFGVDGRKLFRSNQEPFGQTSYLWTRIFLKTRGKILRVEKYGDTCARIASHAEFVTRSCPTRDEPLRTSAWEASAREA